MFRNDGLEALVKRPCLHCTSGHSMHIVGIVRDSGSMGSSIYATFVMQSEADSNHSTFTVVLCIAIVKRACILSLQNIITGIILAIWVVLNTMPFTAAVNVQLL